MSVSVSDAMTSPPVLIETEATVLDAARLMADSEVGAVGVTDDGQLSGVITDRDIVVRALAAGKDPTATRVGDIATSDAVTVSARDSVDEAEHLMVERRVRRLFVLDDGEIVGVLSNDDIAANRDRESVEARQLREGEQTLRRDFQGHTGQGE